MLDRANVGDQFKRIPLTPAEIVDLKPRMLVYIDGCIGIVAVRITALVTMLLKDGRTVTNIHFHAKDPYEVKRYHYRGFRVIDPNNDRYPVFYHLGRASEMASRQSEVVR